MYVTKSPSLEEYYSVYNVKAKAITGISLFQLYVV